LEYYLSEKTEFLFFGEKIRFVCLIDGNVVVAAE